MAIDVLIVFVLCFDGILRAERCFPRLEAGRECAMKPCDVGRNACKKTERLHRLVNTHPAPAQHASTLRGCGPDESGIDRV